MNKYLLATIAILSIILVSGCVSSETEASDENYWPSYDFVELTLENSSVSLSLNQSSCIINGTTEVNNVTINCPSLNISNIAVNVTNGSFSYEVENIPETNIDFNNYTAENAGILENKFKFYHDIINIYFKLGYNLFSF